MLSALNFSMRFFTIKQRLMILLVTLGSITLCMGLGYIVGSAFEKSIFGLITGVVLSFPITQLILVKLMKKESKERMKDLYGA